MAMDVVWFKVIYLFALIAASWVGFVIVLPINQKRMAWLSVATATAGGIFLAAGLVHLLPDAHESLEKFKYPWPYATAVIAFLFFLMLEKAIIPAKYHDQFHAHFDGGNCSHHHDEHEQLIPPSDSSEPINVPPVAPPKKRVISLRNFLLFCALGIHSAIEGTAIGVGAEVPKVTATFIAVISHKWSESAAITVAQRRDDSSMKAIIFFVTMLSLLSPIGIGVGLIVYYSIGVKAEPKHPVVGFLNAVAGGTFIYVSIVEVIMHEFENPAHKWKKFFGVLVGASFMCIVAMVEILVAPPEPGLFFSVN